MFDRLLEAFEKAFELPESKALLSRRWLEENTVEGVPDSTGFCYIAAEAAFHILRGAGLRVRSYCASYTEDGVPSTHWWLEVGDRIVDPTASQYTDSPPPYYLGRGKGFLTKSPSKRAKKLTEIVQKILGDLP